MKFHPETIEILRAEEKESIDKHVTAKWRLSMLFVFNAPRKGIE
jgi:hypothetical protein